MIYDRFKLYDSHFKSFLVVFHKFLAVTKIIVIPMFLLPPININCIHWEGRLFCPSCVSRLEAKLADIIQINQDKCPTQLKLKIQIRLKPWRQYFQANWKLIFAYREETLRNNKDSLTSPDLLKMYSERFLLFASPSCHQHLCNSMRKVWWWFTRSISTWIDWRHHSILTSENHNDENESFQSSLKHYLVLSCRN